ncbi:MAG: DUF1016 domain-containing protein [Lewinellaceae bacterium]|nr:DUF1016 family protein [Phaeodactylibacter sp.]MCB9041680.1 DUF1016 domain-containing protein [Lewinellaceae bacterium]
MNQSLSHTEFYENIRQAIQLARRKVAAAVNTIMVETYWHIGRMIVEEEQEGKERAVYGDKLIPQLAEQLSAEFGKGFNKRNLFYMKQFYLTFPKVNAVRSQLSWTHYRLLMRVANERARDFYLQEAIDGQWSTRTLERQINSFYYERLLASQDKKPVVEEAEDKAVAVQPEDVLRDPYVLEFLQLKESRSYLEKELEAALMDKLQEFLLELGKGFSFVARQKRIMAEGDSYYIDLVFYNYWLKCFVLIDLKVGKLNYQDIGQLDFYVRYWEDHFKPEGDNPTIGIILCSEKNETTARYSVLENSRQLFASKYMLYLPTEEELSKELKREVEEVKLQKRLDKGV